MDNKRGKSITSFLMVVGIIFIIVSGAIFVSSTWGYLPDTVKLVILFAIGPFLLAGSGMLRKKGNLKKTEASLYYLGSIFLAFAMYMACRDHILASVIALIPIGFRFVRDQKAVDFVVTALLTDWIVFWIQIEMEFEVIGSCLLTSCVIIAYSVLFAIREKWNDKKGMETVILVFYILHIFEYSIRNIVVLFVGRTYLKDDVSWMFAALLMAASIVGIFTMHYMKGKNVVFQVLQSLSIFWFAYIGIVFLSDFVFVNMTFEVEFCILFSIFLACTVCFLRKEMLYMILGMGLFLPFIRIVFSQEENSALYFSIGMYAFMTVLFIVGVACYLIRKDKQGKPQVERFLTIVMGLVQILIFIVEVLCCDWIDPDCLCYSICMAQLIAFQCFVNKTWVKKVFQCMALINFELAAYNGISSFVTNTYVLSVECAMIGIGIYFGGKIINPESSLVKWFQYVGACILSIVLLLNAMIDGGVENALILGIAGAIALVIAAIQNSKRYVILSSTVLVLLVFYLTRAIWASIAWWVYLFIAGVVLIGFAVRKEITERNKEESNEE